MATLLAFTAVVSTARQTEAAPGGLQLPWPTASSHNIVAGYTYNCRTHTGLDEYAIDFNFPSPVPVTAVFAGVAYRVYDPAGGNIAWVDHGNKFISLYAHLTDTLTWPRTRNPNVLTSGYG